MAKTRMPETGTLEFSEMLAEILGTPKSKTGEAVKTALRLAAQEVARGQRVEFQKFLSVSRKFVKARTHRNPKTGEAVQKAAHYAPKVSLSRALKSQLAEISVTE